jgi:hypothetical protein
MVSEDYRFFLKKIKYDEEIIIDEQEIDDSEKFKFVKKIDNDGTVVVQTQKIDPDIFFLDVLK